MELPICDLSLGEPRRSVFPGALCKDVLDRKAINHYYPPAGLPALRQHIHARFYPRVNPDLYSIYITHGAIQALDILMRVALHAGDEVLIPDPGFPPYRQLAQFTGATVKTYALRNFSFDLSAMARAITKNTRVLILNSPHNPTGARLSELQREELRQILEEYPDLMLISDEVYSEIVYDGPSQVSLAGLSPRTYVINSFSKTFALQGFRIGWIAAPRNDLPALKTYLLNSMGCVSSLGQEIVLQLLRTTEWQPCSYHGARELALRILKIAGIEVIVPDGAFFVLIRVRDDEDATRKLAEDGIKVVAGRHFGEETRGWIRACFALDDASVIRDFTRLAQAIQRLRLEAS